MKVAQSAARELSKAIREHGARQEDADGTEVYFVEDASAVFGKDASGQRVFQGMSFEMVARDFHVLANLDLVISESEGDSAEGDVYLINDSTLAERVSSYILWRAELLNDLQV